MHPASRLEELNLRMTIHATPPASRTPVPTPPTAADAIVRLHMRSLWRYLRTLGAKPEQADDLTQEAFLVAFRRGAAGLEPAATATFLRRTARFLFLHQLRDRHRDAAFLDAVDELFATAETSGDGERLLDDLRRCLAALPPRSRQAIEQWYGLAADATPQRDALAGALGLRPNGLKALLQRVRSVLRECLERHQS